MSAQVIRTASKPLVWLVVIAATLLTLLALETTGSRHAPSLVPFSQVANQSSNANTGPDGRPAHCTDGHGADGDPQDKNPHCKISHG
jgi:hypothetical protein